LFIALTSKTFAAVHVENGNELRQAYGMQNFRPLAASLQDVKIAVFDQDFDGYEAGKDMLPENAVLVKGQPGALPSRHGLGMAQIVWEMTGRNPLGPQMHLVQVSGLTDLRSAVDYVIQEKIDFVMMSQVYEWGSNGDGTGVFNAEVTRATKAGILWFQAAGNFHGLTYTGRVLPLKNERDGTVTLKGPNNDSLRFYNALDDNLVGITLSWSDNANEDDYATALDLDFVIYDSAGNVVPLPEGSRNLRQIGRFPREQTDKEIAAGKPYEDEDVSGLPRELVALKLERGEYRIKVLARSRNFEETDVLRLVVDPQKRAGFKFIDASPEMEILAPADNANVITVGDRSEVSSIGPSLSGLVKPDTIMPFAEVRFSDNSEYATKGSSNATAALCGIAAVLRANGGRYSHAGFMGYLKELATSSPDETANGSPHFKAPSPWRRLLP